MRYTTLATLPMEFDVAPPAACLGCDGSPPSLDRRGNRAPVFEDAAEVQAQVIAQRLLEGAN